MSTAGALLDRTLREYLYPPGESPSRFKMNDAGGISTSDTSVVTETSWLSPEEEDLIGAGTIIEIGQELILVEAVSGTSPNLTLTIRRAMLGTTAATHADASIIILEPDYGRQAVFEAIQDSVDDLWPTLWKIKTDIIPVNSQWAELDAEVEEVLEARVKAGSQWVKVDPGSYEFLIDFPLASSERAIQWLGAGGQTNMDLDSGVNSTAIVKYKVKPSRPAAEADTLTSLDIKDEWQKAIVVGAAANLLRGEDVDQATSDYITKTLEREGFPVGSGETVSNALLRYQDFLIQRRAAAQNVQTLPELTVERVL